MREGFYRFEVVGTREEVLFDTYTLTFISVLASIVCQADSYRADATVNSVIMRKNKSINSNDDRGSLAYENWQLFLSGESEQSAFEYPLFSDAHFSIVTEMQTDFGPYQLINTQSRGNSSTIPSIVLRSSYHGNNKPPNLNITNVSRYHGGGIEEEISALISLCLGVRLKSGPATRIFPGGKNTKGQPVVMYERNPILQKSHAINPILPYMRGERDLSHAVILESFSHCKPLDSVALVRSARLYQEAVWIAESEPQLSWIMLVSAIETAANHWRASKEPALERLRSSKPELAQILLDSGGEELLFEVADHIADYMGATRKFLDFIMEFLPNSPVERPLEQDQHSWQRDNLKKSLSKIYDWRSRALHGGTPIPYPMCQEARQSGAGWSEVMIGSAYGAQGGVWCAEDAPMMLHLFEHIVRGALLNWWSRSQRPCNS